MVFAQLSCPRLAVSGPYSQKSVKLIPTSCLSGRHVLCLAHSDDVDAGGCSSSLFGCGTRITVEIILCLQFFRQVYYGRYLKKISNRTQEAVGEMTKVCFDNITSVHLFYPRICQVATESLSALRTVQAYNAIPQEELKFHEKINKVLDLARKEAIASGVFYGTTGWSGNVTLLCLLGYGKAFCAYSCMESHCQS